jgi:hypothetical protein
MKFLDRILMRHWPLTRQSLFLDRILAWRITSNATFTLTACSSELKRTLPEAERQLDQLWRAIRALERLRGVPRITSSLEHQQRLSFSLEIYYDVLNFNLSQYSKLGGDVGAWFSGFPQAGTGDLSSPNQRERTPTAVITAPPGCSLRGLAELIFSPKTCQEVFEPICRDLFDEYCEALKQGKIWKARVALVRNYWAFWSAVAAQAPVSAVKVIVKIWKA